MTTFGSLLSGGTAQANLVTLGGARRDVEVSSQCVVGKITSHTPMAFLVSGLETRTVWEPLQTDLLQHGITSLAEQLLGCGSHPEILGEVTAEEIIRRVESSLEELFSALAERPPTVFVGHSLGVAVALIIAANRKLVQRARLDLRGVIALAPPFASRSARLRLLRIIYGIWPGFIRLIGPKLTRYLTLDWYRGRIQRDKNRSGFIERPWIAENIWLYPYFPGKFLTTYFELLAQAEAAIAKLQVPVSAVFAEHDQLVVPTLGPYRCAKKFASRIIDNSGHFIPADYQSMDVALQVFNTFSQSKV
jgi:pimeloyl-ACP methyl ester carboxylesterase